MTENEAWDQAQLIALCDNKFTRARLQGGGFICRCRRCNHAVTVGRLADLPTECPKANTKLHPKPPAGVTQLSFELRGTANDH
jgi:hypothetical protein